MNTTSLAFRLAVPDDAVALGEFMTRNFLAAYGHCSTPDNVRACIAENYDTASQLRQITDPSRWNLIVTAGEAWAGHAQLKSGGGIPEAIGDDSAIEIGRFYVDTAFHGRGVAQAMMREAKAEARRRGAKRICLSCWKEQPQAIRFYEKEGFRIAGELVFMVGDDPKDDWLMICELDGSLGEPGQTRLTGPG